MVKRPATERIFPLLPTLKKDLPREDEELTSNFSESDSSFDLVCVVPVLPVEYDVLSEVNEVEIDFTDEMAIHKPLCYYVMNNGCVEDQHAVFERPDSSMRLHLKPLFIQAKINDVGVNKVLVDGGATVNFLPQSFLGKIGLSDFDLKPHNVILTNYEGTTENSLCRVCIDFKDLNLATPKDEYPMPVAEMLVDSTAGFEYLSMLDGYSAYNQIFIAEEDVPKTAFRCPGALGCYEWLVMPFGLKNAGATYQRAMNSMFHDFIEDFM